MTIEKGLIGRASAYILVHKGKSAYKVLFICMYIVSVKVITKRFSVLYINDPM